MTPDASQDPTNRLTRQVCSEVSGGALPIIEEKLGRFVRFVRVAEMAKAIEAKRKAGILPPQGPALG